MANSNSKGKRKTILEAYGVASRGRYIDKNKGAGSPNAQNLEFQKEKGICNAITTVYKDFMVLVLEKEE